MLRGTSDAQRTNGSKEWTDGSTHGRGRTEKVTCVGCFAPKNPFTNKDEAHQKGKRWGILRCVEPNIVVLRLIGTNSHRRTRLARPQTYINQGLDY